MSFISAHNQYKVFLVTESQNDPNVDQDTLKKIADSDITLLPSIDSFSITRIPATLRSISKLRSYIKEYKINLVHVLFATPYALWVNFIGLPTVITTRGSDVLLVLPELRKNGLRNRALNFLFKRAFQKASMITSTSKVQVEELHRNYKTQKNMLIRTGVDVDLITSDLTQYLPNGLTGKEIVFSPRYFKPVYNLEIQIEAIKQLPARILNRYTFVFIKTFVFNKSFKDKQYVDDTLEQLSKADGLDYVILDALEPQQMWAIFRYAKLTLMTPLSDGTPNSALEAMAARCPLITSDLNYDEALFSNTCLKCNPKDAIDVMSKIILALENYPLNLIDNAFRAVNEHGNRKKEMQKLINLYSTFA